MASSVSRVSSQYPTTEEVIAMFRVRPKCEGESSKCLVYALVIIVFLLAIFLVTETVRVRVPEVELRSPKLVHLSYNTTSRSPSFNVSMTVHLIIKNHNLYGGFVYEENKVRVVYRGTVVGVSKIGSGRVKAGESKDMKLGLKMKSNRRLVSGILTSDLHAGVLEFKSYAKLRAKLNLLNFVKKRTTTLMACSMYVNLTSHSVHQFQC